MKFELQVDSRLAALGDAVHEALLEELGRSIVELARPRMPYRDGGLRRSARFRVQGTQHVRISVNAYGRTGPVAERTREAIRETVRADRQQIVDNVTSYAQRAIDVLGD